MPRKMSDWPIRWRWYWPTRRSRRQNSSAGRKPASRWRKPRFTSLRRLKATVRSWPSARPSKMSNRVEPCPSRNISATLIIRERNGSVMAKVINTPTTTKAISWLKSISRVSGAIMSRPSKVRKNGSRSAWRNGERKWRSPRSKVQSPKAAAASREPYRRAGKTRARNSGMHEKAIGSKAVLRREVRAALAKISAEEKAIASESARRILVQQEVWQKAQSILFFAPTQNEVDIWPLLEGALGEGKIVALPRFVPERVSYTACCVQ